MFSNQSIVFTNINTNTNTDTDTNKTQFGLLKLETVLSPFTEKELELLFKVDCSGSMSDLCSDGRSKMQHILHTLKNMVLFFKENPSIHVNVTIHSFDDRVYTVVDRTRVTDETYAKIVASIDTISPRTSTNIEKALDHTKTMVSKMKEQYPDSVYHQIFLTDGQATSGSTSHQTLCECVDDTITNVFIGFGLDHDASLLTSVSSKRKGASYFIDKIENAGLVYGEIVHGFVYRILENVVLTAENGTLYNFKTGNWETELYIGDVVGDSKKFYHIHSDHPEDCRVTIRGNRVEDGEEVTFTVDNTGTTEDLTKYVYRQRTMEMLYRVNQFIHTDEAMKIEKEREENENEKENEEKKNKKLLKVELNDLFVEIKKYMTDNGLTEDVLLRNLCDDIYVCRRTFGTQYEVMYCCARMFSQGTQRAYTATHVPEEEEVVSYRNVLRRQHLRQSFINVNVTDDDDDYEDYDNDDIPAPFLGHNVSNSTDTPYQTQTMTYTMRCVSGGSNEEETQEYH
jgi:hypothetical protein